jgi:hypothetical protein
MELGLVPSLLRHALPSNPIPAQEFWRGAEGSLRGSCGNHDLLGNRIPLLSPIGDPCAKPRAPKLPLAATAGREREDKAMSLASSNRRAEDV